MEIKQRVVGAVVLVALAVIFIPMILEKPHQDTRHQVLPVPPSPQIEPFKVERATPPRLTGAVPAVESADVSGGSKPHELASGSAPTDTPSVPGYRVIEKDGVASQSVPPVADRAPAKSEALDVQPEPVKAEPVKAAPPPAKPVAESRPAEEPKAASVTSGWTIQIGTFKNRSSALAIRDELLADKTGGYVQDFRSSDGQTLTRVFAGPFLQRAQADKIKGEIDKRYKVSSLVVQYQPSR